MSKAQQLRELIHQRLLLAADEIFSLFEKTFLEYEEERRLQPERGRTRLSSATTPPSGRGEASLTGAPQRSPSIKEEHEERQQGALHRREEELQPARGRCVGDRARPVSKEAGLPRRKWDDSPEPEPEPANTLEAQTGCGGDACPADWKEPLSCLDPGVCWPAAPDPRSASQTGPAGGAGDGARRGRGRGAGEPKAFLCSFCGKRFSKSSNLTTHLRVHTGEKPFTCSVCSSSFSLRCTLVTHMRVHTGEKPFVCFLCGKRFTKKANLNVHMAVHTEEKAYSCPACHRRFTWHSQVRNHKCPGAGP